MEVSLNYHLLDETKSGDQQTLIYGKDIGLWIYWMPEKARNISLKIS